MIDPIFVSSICLYPNKLCSDCPVTIICTQGYVILRHYLELMYFIFDPLNYMEI